MNKKVRKALEGLKNRDRLITENRKAVIVYEDELDAVLEWVEANKPLADEIRVGDKVETLVSVLDIPQGSTGTVIHTESETFASYPYTVKAGGVYNGKYARSELRKVEDD